MLTCKVIGVFFFLFFSSSRLLASSCFFFNFFLLCSLVIGVLLLLVILLGVIHDFGNGIWREKDVGEGCSQLHFSSIYNEDVDLVKFRRSALLHCVWVINEHFSNSSNIWNVNMHPKFQKTVVYYLCRQNYSVVVFVLSISSLSLSTFPSWYNTYTTTISNRTKLIRNKFRSQARTARFWT